MSRIWSWSTVTGQRTDFDARGKRIIVETGDDLSGLVGILHDIHHGTTTSSGPKDNAIARCSQPVDYCRIHLVAYHSSLGGWVCTSPPTAEDELYPGTALATIERDGIEYRICSRCTPAAWHLGPQVSYDPHRSPSVRDGSDSRSRPDAIRAFIVSRCRDVMRVVERSRALHLGSPQSERLAEVACWLLGVPTNRSVTIGDPDHEDVAFFAEWIRAHARRLRPWETPAESSDKTVDIAYGAGYSGRT